MLASVQFIVRARVPCSINFVKQVDETWEETEAELARVKKDLAAALKVKKQLLQRITKKDAEIKGLNVTVLAKERKIASLKAEKNPKSAGPQPSSLR